MKVHYLREAHLKEDYVDVHYSQESETIELIKDFFLSFHSICGRKDDCVKKLHSGSIYYLEVVDRKLFAYQLMMAQISLAIKNKLTKELFRVR